MGLKINKMGEEPILDTSLLVPCDSKSKVREIMFKNNNVEPEYTAVTDEKTETTLFIQKHLLASKDDIINAYILDKLKSKEMEETK